MQLLSFVHRRPWLLAGFLTVATAIGVLGFGGTLGAQDGTAGDPRVIDTTDLCSVADVEPAPFDDRDEIADVHVDAVDCAFARGVTRGAEGGDVYRPRMPVRRDQMASYVLRTLEVAGGIDIPSPSSQGFTDISGNTHEDAINQLAALGVTQGRTANRYAPDQPVRRDQMASFIMRAAGVAFDTSFEATQGPHFSDVTDGPHVGNVDAAFELFGLTIGRADGRFVPGMVVPRDQMATFLIRLLDVIELTEGSATPESAGLVERLGEVVPSPSDDDDPPPSGEDGLLDGLIGDEGVDLDLDDLLDSSATSVPDAPDSTGGDDTTGAGAATTPPPAPRPAPAPPAPAPPAPAPPAPPAPAPADAPDDAGPPAPAEPEAQEGADVDEEDDGGVIDSLLG